MSARNAPEGAFLEEEKREGGAPDQPDMNVGPNTGCAGEGD